MRNEKARFLGWFSSFLAILGVGKPPRASCPDRHALLPPKPRHDRALCALVFAVALVSTVLASKTSAAQQLITATSEGGSRELPLVRESLEIEIDQQHVQTLWRTTYQNETRDALEGTYLVRAGDGFSVSGFAYYNGEQRIEGQVFEKHLAREVYEEITGLNRDPGLVEKIGEGAFSFRVAPIAPGEQKRIEVTLDGYVKRKGRKVEYRTPLAGSKAQVHIALRDTRRVSDVSSPTHRLTTRRSENGALEIDALGSSSAGELVLHYEIEDAPWSLSAALHRDSGQDAYVWLSLPAENSATPAPPKDVTLVLDRSGSMSGEPLENARAAAANLIARLGEQDHINVLAFDDGVDALYHRPRQVSKSVRLDALAYVRRIDEGGGTDIARALERALAAQERSERPRFVLFVTDGQSDSQAALAAAKADRLDTRVFTVGVGPGVEKPLLSRLASMTRGRFTFIERASAIETSIAALYGQLERTRLVNVSLDVVGPGVERVYPKALPDVFNADELVIAARLRGSGPAILKVSGVLDGKPRTFERWIRVPEQIERAWVGRSWAQARVDDLLEEVALSGESDELKSETLELALAYDLVTPYTSFLAIPESELTQGARARLGSAREAKAKILAAHPDAVALSRSLMPPGDPELSVRAGPKARLVTAYFPFGLVQELTYDASRELWSTRFLVPNDVADGPYDVKIVIVEADGSVRIASARYVIDSKAPELDVEFDTSGGGVTVVVRAAERLREVRAVVGGEVYALTPDPSALAFTGKLPEEALRLGLRVVAVDLARNETEQTVVAGLP